jgi:hypothetical protein
METQAAYLGKVAMVRLAAIMSVETSLKQLEMAVRAETGE